MFLLWRFDNKGADIEVNIEDLCILDIGTTHTILKHKRYFFDLKPTNAIINSISGLIDLIEGHGKAHIVLPSGTSFFINNALFSPKSKRNLLSFNDIYLHEFDTQSLTEYSIKYMYITSDITGKRYMLEKLPKFPTGLHYIYINVIESYMVVKR